MNSDEGTFSGTLLGESIRLGAVLDAVPLTVTNVHRAAAGDVEAGAAGTLDVHRVHRRRRSRS